MQDSTTRDPGEDRWPINDEVLRLRQWATERSQTLPSASGKELVIGS